MMEDSEFAVTAFFAEFIIAILLFVELGTPFYQFADPVNAFFNHDLHNSRVTQSIPRNQSILNMFIEAVILCIHHTSYSTLCVLSICFISLRLGYNQNLFIGELSCDFQGVGQAGNTGSNNQEICLHQLRLLTAESK